MRIALISRLVVAYAIAVIAAWACGPHFHDAHHGMTPVRSRLLEEYAAQIFGRGPLDLRAWQQQQWSRRDVALRLENEGETGKAAVAWREMLASDWDEQHFVDRLSERVTLYALIGDRQRALHLAALLERSRSVPQIFAAPHAVGSAPRGDPVPEILAHAAAADQAGEPIVRAFLTLAAARRLMLRSADEAEALLNAVRTDEQIAAVYPEATQEAHYLLCCLPIARSLRDNKPIPDAAAALIAFTEFCAAYPQSSLVAAARGWEGFIFCQHEHIGFGGYRGAEVATQIYAGLARDASATRAFIGAVGSLRHTLRRLRPVPPAFVRDDAQLAALWSWHACTDRHDHAPGDPSSATAAAQRTATLAEAAALIARYGVAIDRSLAHSLARACHDAGSASAGLALLRQADQNLPDTQLLAVLLACQQRDIAAAETGFAQLRTLAPQHPEIADCCLRLSALHESAGRYDAALRYASWAGSIIDLSIIADGEMPLDDLVRFLAQHDRLPALGQPAQDLRPHLQAILAKRLVRHGRYDAARSLLNADAQDLLQRLIAHERAAGVGPGSALPSTAAQTTNARAADPARAAALLTLGKFWYEEAKPLIFSNLSWTRWASDRIDARREPELIAMTTYARAYPILLAAVDADPTADTAAEALWLAAHCRWWLTGTTYLRIQPYWEERAQREGYWAEGEALMRRLAREHPAHPLAQEPKVLRSLDAAPLK